MSNIEKEASMTDIWHDLRFLVAFGSKEDFNPEQKIDFTRPDGC
jgi:hypothetical protein